MGVHSEAELRGIESTESQTEAGVSQEQVESLRVAASTIARELQVIGDKVSELVASIEALGPISEGRIASKKASEPDQPQVEADDGRAMTVTVSPLPELAMAAVAETTLRNLPGVRQVSSVTREGDWAEFTLDVSPDADLVAEMRTSMPVSFTVIESSPEAISLSLQWAWGTS